MARIAVAGNACVLVLIVLAACHADRLIGTQDRAVLPAREARTSTTNLKQHPVVFVVIDGLRADTARAATVMPFLKSLAAEGGHGVASVECLIPSSVAAIETFTTGRVPAPASVLTDFTALPNEVGGLLAAVDRAGRTAFVAGPSLWTDKYGRWIDESDVDRTFGSHDESLLAASLAQLRSARHALVIVHFGSVDRAAHRSGATSKQYRDTARWCDDAVRKIVHAMPHEASIIVTSDHGNRDAGGHAGLEQSVVETPVIVRGADLPTGELGRVRQRDVHALLAASLGHSDRSADLSASGVRAHEHSDILVASLAALACLFILTALHSGVRRAGVVAFPLNATVWVSIALIIAGEPTLAAFLSTAALAAAAIGVRSRLSGRLMIVVAIACIVGMLRALDTLCCIEFGQPYELAVRGFGTLCVASIAFGSAVASYKNCGRGSEAVVATPLVFAALGWLVGGLPLTLIAAASVLCGRFLAEAFVARKDLALSGALTLALAVVLARLDGNTLSLSTIDVRSAFSVVEWRFGVPLAALLVVLAQALPTIGLLSGFSSAFSRDMGSEPAAFAAGLAACVVGQAVVAAGIFGAAQSAYVESLALGLLVRVIAEAMYAFLGLAILSVCLASVKRLTERRPSLSPELR